MVLTFFHLVNISGIKTSLMALINTPNIVYTHLNESKIKNTLIIFIAYCILQVKGSQDAKKRTAVF